MPDQLYWPNLATSYLYLFSTVKEKLERIHLADEDQFLEYLQRVLRGLDQRKSNRIFQASVRLVQQVSEGNGGSVGW
jgi:endonuclease III